ncbi:MAG: transglycosylase family protein [Streptosporangiaceae bacterium]
MAAAIALSAQVTAGPAAASTITHHAASAPHQRGVSSAQLLAAIRSAAAQKPVTASKPSASLPAKYTVRDGDTLSAIAGNLYHDPNAWPVLYWANHSKIRWANNIDAGLVLTVPAKPAHIPAAPSQLAPAPAPAAATETASTEPASTEQSASATTAEPTSTYTGSSSFQECVIERESGGDSQVMNSSGHYGLYQFSASTWAAYGGNPADFGDASVAEQNEVFDTAIADGGASNWSAYDGC